MTMLVDHLWLLSVTRPKIAHGLDDYNDRQETKMRRAKDPALKTFSLVSYELRLQLAKLLIWKLGLKIFSLFKILPPFLFSKMSICES